MQEKSSFFLFAFLLVPSLFVWTIPKVEASSLLYSNDFESGFGVVEKHVECYSHTYSIVSSPARTGSKAVKHFMEGNRGCHHGQFGASSVVKHRAMLKYGYKKDLLFAPKTPYWFGFSMFVPNDYPTHTNEGTFVWGFIGGGGTPGEHAAMIRGDKLRIARRWHANGKLNESWDAEIPVKKGQWMDIVVYLYRSWQSDGVLKVWIDGTKVVDKIGPNATDYGSLGHHDPYFRTGIYWGPENRINNHTLYFDSVKIAQGLDGYNLVTTTDSIPPGSPGGLQITKSGK